MLRHDFKSHVTINMIHDVIAELVRNQSQIDLT